MTKSTYFIDSQSFTAKALAGGLYLVSTPIGNLADITIRALQTLAGADYVVCEDTRVTRVLLEAYAIDKKLLSYHEHSANSIEDKLLDLLRDGCSIALVSDAGTPLISDPGFKLVQRALAENLKVVPIPGASSVLTALVASGLPTNSFTFIGFLSSKKNSRLKQLSELRRSSVTVVGFESPHRLLDSLEDMISEFGENKQISLGRELTKRYEEIHTDTLINIYNFYKKKDKIKGEFVFILSPAEVEQKDYSSSDIDSLLLSLSDNMSTSKAAAEAHLITGIKKSDLYNRLLKIKDNGDQ